MNKALLYCFSIASILSFQSCTEKDEIEINPPIKSEAYEPCCGTPSEVIRELAPGIKIFVPNAFTPNGDGINDYFYPLLDTTIISNGSVILFSIFDSNDDKVRRLLHSGPGGFLHSDVKSYAFNGSYYDQTTFKREIWRGQFWYEMIISSSKGYWEIEGSACSIVCDDEAPIFKNKEGCFFPIQADSKGNYISSTPPGEEACFGN